MCTKGTVKYSIGLSTQPDSEIYADYECTISRKKRTLALPSSVKLSQAKNFWKSLVFHHRKDEEAAPKTSFQSEYFTTQLTQAVEKYRELSREGRLQTEKMAREEAGRPKIVLGSGVYVPEED